METTSVLMMILILGFVWGGTAYLLRRAGAREKSKTS